MRVKMTAWATMTVSLTALLLGGASWIVVLVSAALMSMGAIFIARCPSVVKPTQHSLDGDAAPQAAPPSGTTTLR